MTRGGSFPRSHAVRAGPEAEPMSPQAPRCWKAMPNTPGATTGATKAKGSSLPREDGQPSRPFRSKKAQEARSLRALSTAAVTTSPVPQVTVPHRGDLRRKRSGDREARSRLSSTALATHVPKHHTSSTARLDHSTEATVRTSLPGTALGLTLPEPSRGTAHCVV